MLWKYESPLNIHGRGLAYWPGDATHGGRLYFGTDEGYFSALDIKTGKLATDFGVNGTLDASYRRGLGQGRGVPPQQLHHPRTRPWCSRT